MPELRITSSEFWGATHVGNGIEVHGERDGDAVRAATIVLRRRV
jgi:hypothetical protein